MVNYQSEDAEIIGKVLQKYSTVGQLPAMPLIGVRAMVEEKFFIEVDAEAVVNGDG
ncbi:MULTISPECIES: hypothetical protein [unclassified Leptolyngbya]|uniref:hypothetical protein n=1 Tax=unclassified Leptolyngbya TaxID=2650499 RepID=UPI00168460FA|nr:MULTISPECIES: hypothetical protein [unclassified Leptolyngbya]MBD1912653.1 hypothetical protein [Leptolyngbya sp. FACHB-8]